MKHPEVLWLLILIFPLILLFQWRFRTGRRDVELLGGRWRSDLLKDVFVVKWFFSTLGFLLFYVGVVLSLAGFPGETRKVPYQFSGSDVIFLVDISRSMLALDEEPSRLGRASGIIRGISGGLEGGRFGLVAFRGMGVNLFPLSEDRVGLDSLVDNLSPDLITSSGTDLADGFAKALDALSGGSQNDEIIILLSDGEGLSGDVAPHLKRLREQNVRLLVVGLGSAEGTIIPLPGGGAVMDQNGRTVTTRLALRELERIVDLGDGELFTVSQPNLVSLLLERLEGGGFSRAEGYREEETERFRFFLFLSLLGLVLYQGVRIIKWKDTF